MAKYPRSFHVVSVALAVLIVVLSACSGGAQAPVAPTAAAPAATTAAPAAAAPAAAAPTAAPAVAPTAAPAAAPAKVVEYNITAFTDLSSPQAANSKSIDPARKVAIAYWNETEGKELSIKINMKTYDSRYDPTVTASVWPGALAGDKPILALASSNPEAVALGERLPNDKVPMFFGVPGVSSFWRPNQWLFFAQPPYPHQMAGFLNWRLTSWTGSGPLRLGHISSQASPTYVDLMKGIQNSIAKGTFGTKVEDAGVEWVGLQALEVSSEIKRLLDKKADYITAFIASQTVVAMLRALEQYKAANTKLLFFGASGIQSNALATPVKDFEGAYEVSPLVSAADTANEGYKVYQQYKDKVGAGDIAWTGTTEFTLAGSLIALRAVGRAAKKVGADKLTGQAIYDAMYGVTTTSKELLGVIADITYNKDAPFPTQNLKMSISTVKDGKFQPATAEWVPAPEIPKW